MVIILYLWYIQNGAPKLLLMAQPLKHPQSESGSSVGDRAYPVAGAWVWNALPPSVTSPPLSLSPFRRLWKLFSFSNNCVNNVNVSWSWSACTQHHVNPGELNWTTSLWFRQTSTNACICSQSRSSVWRRPASKLPNFTFELKQRRIKI